MGIKISIFEGLVPQLPRDIVLTMRCDGAALLCDEQEFRHAEGFIGCYHDAMRAGWKDTNRDGIRVFYGPCCSGKAVDSADSIEAAE